ncbi:methyltransferase domain-containing protein [Streptosporangiaceae bacterium NEAU-GS5]|nr:methyltransferase domain-containing protein [Streptosporangiaceae bacterium NEAU-GS5]
MRHDAGLFFGQFVRAPAVTGAVAPSSRALSEAVAAPVPERGEPVVVELGPGTGPFTAEIQRRLAGRGRHLAVEVNQRFAARLAAAHPYVELVVGDAVGLAGLLGARGVDAADVIVSGLPWAAFSAARQTALLDAVVAVLRPEGAFTTFSYVHSRALPPGMAFRRRLTAAFEEVVAGRTVWRNLPPAYVYHSRRPRTSF